MKRFYVRLCAWIRWQTRCGWMLVDTAAEDWETGGPAVVYDVWLDTRTGERRREFVGLE